MRRAIRILGRLFAVLAVAAVVVLVLYMAILPMIVRGQIRAALDQAGLRHATFDLRSVSLGSLQLSNVRFGDASEWSAAAVSISYSPGELMSGRIDTIELSGAQWMVSVADGKLSLGPLDALAKQGPPQAPGGGELPFQRLRLRSSMLILNLPAMSKGIDAQRWYIPIEATFDNEGKGRIAVQGDARIADLPLRLTGAIQPTDDGVLVDLRAGGQADVAATAQAGGTKQAAIFHAAAAPQGSDAAQSSSAAPAVVEPATQSFSLQMRYEQTRAGGDLDIQLRGSRDQLEVLALGKHIQMQGASLDARVSLRRLQQLKDVDVQMRIASLTLDDQSLDDIEMDLKQAGDQIEARTAVRVGDWRLQSLTVTAPSDVSQWTKPQLELPVTWRLESGAAPAVESAEEPPVEQAAAPTPTAPAVPTAAAAPSPASAATAPAEKVVVEGSASLKPMLVVAGGATDDKMPVMTDGRIAIHLGSKKDALTLGDMEFALANSAASAASSADATVFNDADIRVGKVQWAGESWPAIVGTLKRGDAGFALDMNWPLSEEAPLTVKANLDTSGPKAAFNLNIRAAKVPLGKDTRLGKLMHDASSMNITGAVSVEVQVTVSEGKVQPKLVMSVHDATVTPDEGQFLLEGVNTSIMMTSFSPPSTPGGQRITWARVTMGEYEFHNGVIDFTLESPQSLLIEQARFQMGDTGRFWAQAFRFNPAEPEISTELLWEGVNVKQWVELVTNDKMTGEGRLFGRLQLHLRTKPEFFMTLRRGFLYAEGEGTLKLLDPESAHALLGMKGEDAPVDLDLPDDIKNRMVQALQDFEYTVLRFDLTTEGGEPLMRVFTKGRGRTGAKQEFGGITVNVRNVEKLLNLGLQAKLGFDRGASRSLTPSARPKEESPAQPRPVQGEKSETKP